MGLRDGPQDAGQPDGILEGGKETGAILTSEAVRGLARAGSGELGRGGARVAREPGERRIPRRDALGEEPPQPVDAFARLRRDDEQRDVAQPVVREQLPGVVSPCAGLRRGEKVGLVEHDGHGRRVRRERPQVPLVQGGVRVLLRLDDPQDEIRECDHALRLRAMPGLDRVEVRQVEQHEAVELVRRQLVPFVDRQPAEQAVRAAAPDRCARGARRRTPPADDGELRARDPVEQPRLADPGRPRECDDRMLEPEPKALAGPLDHPAGALDQRVVEPPARKLGGLAEREQPLLEVALPHAARSATVASCSRPKASADDAAASSSASNLAASPRSRPSTRSSRSSRARAARLRTAWSPKIASSTF